VLLLQIMKKPGTLGRAFVTNSGPQFMKEKNK